MWIHLLSLLWGNLKSLQVRAEGKSCKKGWCWFRYSKWCRWCRTGDMAWETWFGNSTAANPAAGWRQENGKIPTPGEHFRPVPSLSGGTHIDWSKECVVPGFELTLDFFWLFGTKFSGLELSSKHPGKPHPMALLRYSTFLRVFKARWSDVLKFREKNLCLANNKPYMFIWQLKLQWVCLIDSKFSFLFPLNHIESTP